MSNYLRRTKHPKTGEFELAEWLDDFYGKHRYGVKFPSDEHVYRADDYVFEFDDETEVCEVCGRDHETGDCSF